MHTLTKERFRYGKGITLIDDSGKEYLDGVSGTFNLSLGYNHPHVVTKVQEQVANLAHMSSSFTEPYVEEVLDHLIQYTPNGIDAGWMRDITGSTANECAVKLAQKYTGALDIISLYLSHHGQTQFATGISGNAFRRRKFPNSAAANSLHVPAPYCYRCPFNSSPDKCGYQCVEAISDAIEYASSGSVACMIIEPILGNGGNIIPPAGYFKRLRQLCNEYGLILIADEVQTGIGRTGYMFASELLDIQPDIITLAKGLGGIGVPVAAVLMQSRLNVLEKHEHSFTSGSNLISVTAAKATLEVVSEPGFLEAVRSKGSLLGTLLTEMADKHDCIIGEARGVGLMWGLEIVDEDNAPDAVKSNAIIDRAFAEQQLILRGSRYGYGNVVKVRPSLTATEDEIVEIVKRLDTVLTTLH
ncbi:MULTISPECIES: aspartate aminotransferase family protein [Paenibacillus]|uniref:Acetylornithine aminotransferase n=2 Tax=Paenibacillus TaxID=44249 RepID=A0AAJ3MHJ8_PAEPO|nr:MULTISPECIES: aspartate aminotransferase family protein [Paenibacillus]MBP1176305.1 4-aminobutyrate aminotransferase [Paenibacillus sp. PvR133]MCP3747652.1 aspartate aminotransferase family protein [Paenibacillus sp. A3M_27_13]AIW39961.1 acetylornithine aminotransferase [Paenibacillus polymyxa CR1]ALA42265.1 acetylornithine aminotransferase [Paenibacillus peoriae]APQ59454.1 acetylornithine aminotransferase [Paenibacillus polymyxa]